jgi:hypothetical protein
MSYIKDLWIFLEDSSEESKSCSISNIEKIQRSGGQQNLSKGRGSASGLNLFLKYEARRGTRS